MHLPLESRIAAGRLLAEALADFRDRPEVIVLALPRGGVPIACELATSLGAEMDVILVQKLGTPGQEELAMGAIGSGGVRVLNDNIVTSLRISEADIERVAFREQRELERCENAFRSGRPKPEVRGRTVIVVDDGLATGAGMRAAVAVLRQQQAGRIIVAVPVAPAETVALLRREADSVICLSTPEPFIAVGRWYNDFTQISEQEVIDMLAEAWQSKPASARS